MYTLGQSGKNYKLCAKQWEFDNYTVDAYIHLYKKFKGTKINRMRIIFIWELILLINCGFYTLVGNLKIQKCIRRT